MIKVKLIVKSKNKCGDIKREVLEEKEIRKNKDYRSFISELSKAFSIPKNIFILMLLAEDEEEYPINDQEDMVNYLEEVKEFMVIVEEKSFIKNKLAKIGKKKKKKKERKNCYSETNDDKKINRKISFNMSEQEIEQIMNSFYMPEIDNINDEIEFDIEKYKEEFIRNSTSKIEDFKKDFEADAKNMISQKFNIIKNNINKLVLSSQEEQEKNLELKEEEDNKMNNEKGKLKNQLLGKKNEFSEIIKKQDNYAGGVNDMISKDNDDDFKNEDQLMIKFEKEEIKHAVNIKEAKLFKIDNIKLSNFGMREFNNLFFVIDIDKSSKNLLFYENFTNKANHKLSPSWSFQREENVNNNVTFFFKDPKVKENSIFIYVSEKQWRKFILTIKNYCKIN